MSDRTGGGPSRRNDFYKYLGAIGILCIVVSFLMGDRPYANVVGAFGFAAIVVSFIDEYRYKRSR